MTFFCIPGAGGAVNAVVFAFFLEAAIGKAVRSQQRGNEVQEHAVECVCPVMPYGSEAKLNSPLRWR